MQESGGEKKHLTQCLDSHILGGLNFSHDIHRRHLRHL